MFVRLWNFVSFNRSTYVIQASGYMALSSNFIPQDTYTTEEV